MIIILAFKSPPPASSRMLSPKNIQSPAILFMALSSIVMKSSSWPKCYAKGLGEICSYKTFSSVRLKHLFLYKECITTLQVFSLSSLYFYFPCLKNSNKKRKHELYIDLCPAGPCDVKVQLEFICLFSVYELLLVASAEENAGIWALWG